MVPNDREFEVIFLENLHPLLQDDSGIEHPGLVALVVYVVLTILRYLEVCGAYLRTKYSFLRQLSLKPRIFKDKSSLSCGEEFVQQGFVQFEYSENLCIVGLVVKMNLSRQLHFLFR